VLKKIIGVVIGYFTISIGIPSINPIFNFSPDYVHIGEYTYKQGKVRNVKGIVFTNKSANSGGYLGDLYQAGIRSELGILSESDFEQFKQIESSGQCAAGFLNSNSQMILIIPEDSKTTSRIKRLQKGDEVEFKATYLTDLTRNIGDSEIPIRISGVQIALVSSIN
jgi:hypothetical protein